MKFSLLSIVILAFCMLTLPAVSQTEKETDALGLPGDNLDLFAVLDLFQKSKTIEDFEKELNLEKTGINNLDLDLDDKVDFIKVETKQKDDDFTFILQVAISEKETQDVAVILVSKDDKGEISMQIVGDKDLYGKDYIVEPQETLTPGSTPNPGYTGDDPVTDTIKATTKVVVVESAPIVQYVYSPVYVPYYPPYYYGYYPPYYTAFAVMSFSIYASNHYHYHHHGYGHGYGHSTVIVNNNNYNNYNSNRNNSATVSNNMAKGNYTNNKSINTAFNRNFGIYASFYGGINTSFHWRFCFYTSFDRSVHKAFYRGIGINTSFDWNFSFYTTFYRNFSICPPFHRNVCIYTSIDGNVCIITTIFFIIVNGSITQYVQQQL